jgi:hypothetical protein
MEVFCNEAHHQRSRTHAFFPFPPSVILIIVLPCLKIQALTQPSVRDGPSSSLPSER